MLNTPPLLTYFPAVHAGIKIPEILPSPFAHQPHPLAVHASRMLQQRLTEQEADYHELSQGCGKMLGVLVVRDAQGKIGFLSAFSGMMRGQWHVQGFVPPLFDQAMHDSFYPAGEKTLGMLTHHLHELECSGERACILESLSGMQLARDQALDELRHHHIAARAARRLQRKALHASTGLPEAERTEKMAALALASQHHKRESVNASADWQAGLNALQEQLDKLEAGIETIRRERSELSRSLHRQVFACYVLHNHLHEQMPMSQCFTDSTPPAGSGDCAAPKLLNHAVRHGLHPLALAEFWWGASPATGVRRHGHFYPACRGKCHPILPFMLRGLRVEPDPCYTQPIAADEPHIVYEDDVLLVVNKPAGLLSVPGSGTRDCVITRLQQRYPECPEICLVHRLDMGTSGLLLVARDMATHKQLQRQFIRRQVEKRYEALLAGHLPAQQTEGEINLPLRIDFDDRPRQMVCYEYGKPALTRWQFIAREDGVSRVYFYPQTGRTHQLRVHAAHRDGLNTAIVGDGLYGDDGERLMLHAQRLCFSHPINRKWLEFEVQAPF